MTKHSELQMNYIINPWLRHQMETFSALLALCEGNSPVTGEVPSQRPVTRSFDVFVDLRMNKQLSKHLWGWWFETPSRTLWRHCNAIAQCLTVCDHILQKSIIWFEFKTLCAFRKERPENILHNHNWPCCVVCLPTYLLNVYHICPWIEILIISIECKLSWTH